MALPSHFASPFDENRFFNLQRLRNLSTVKNDGENLVQKDVRSKTL